MVDIRVGTSIFHTACLQMVDRQTWVLNDVSLNQFILLVETTLVLFLSFPSIDCENTVCEVNRDHMDHNTTTS